VLVPDMATSDDDFPDLWHLRQSRSAEFSRSLARVWTEWERAHARAVEGAEAAVGEEPRRFHR
jgi:hypothetical protein